MIARSLNWTPRTRPAQQLIALAQVSVSRKRLLKGGEKMNFNDCVDNDNPKDSEAEELAGIYALLEEWVLEDSSVKADQLTR